MTLVDDLKAARADPRDTCPNFHDHTPCPDGYMQWHAWAKKMSRTHKQERCSGCGRLSIWAPRQRRARHEAD